MTEKTSSVPTDSMRQEVKMFKYLLAATLCLVTYAAPIQDERCAGLEDFEFPRTCLDLLCKGSRLNGVYKVYPQGTELYSIDVFCDQMTDGGGWTVFQRRMDGWVDFYRNWQNYKLGFGNVNGEHWLGNDNLHNLLGLRQNELRIDLESFANEKTYAMYSNFSVGDESTEYLLSLSDFAGTAGDSLSYGNGMKFSTLDRDQDTSAASNCAVVYHGAWWYAGCHNSNLNGNYHNGAHKSFADGINWSAWKTYYESLKTTEMKFRALS